MLESQRSIDKDRLRDEFSLLYGTEPRLFRAPGRINLIGEHTDYNDGFVLPMAINRETVVAAAPRNDRLIRARSNGYADAVEINLDEPGSPRRGSWRDYVEGVARELVGLRKSLTGADLLIWSTVPPGAGLSASAALEVSIGYALLAVSGEELDPLSLAIAGRDAEHNYAGTMCGIMDQYAATFSMTGHALLLDCRSLESKVVPVDSSDLAILVCDTKVKHNLASSEYNRRRSECEQGVSMLRRFLPGAHSLRDISLADLERHQDLLPETILRRCRHVVTENSRTLLAAEVLRTRDFETMGALMAESHRSLRDDFEVSCRELDLMFEIARSIDGVIGARMTGGGFGGCTINLVRRNGIAECCDAILTEYQRETGIAPAGYLVASADGAGEIM